MAGARAVCLGEEAAELVRVRISCFVSVSVCLFVLSCLFSCAKCLLYFLVRGVCSEMESDWACLHRSGDGVQHV